MYWTGNETGALLNWTGNETGLASSLQESVEVWQQRVREMEGEVATRNKMEVRLQTLQEVGGA